MDSKFCDRSENWQASQQHSSHVPMMTSSNGNISRVTAALCGEFTGDCPWINRWVNNREAGDLRRHRTNCDVSVMQSETMFSMGIVFSWFRNFGRWNLIDTFSIYLINHIGVVELSPCHMLLRGNMSDLDKILSHLISVKYVSCKQFKVFRNRHKFIKVVTGPRYVM